MFGSKLTLLAGPWSLCSQTFIPHILQPSSILEIIEDENLVHHANDMGDYLLGQLKELMITYQKVFN